MMAGRGDELPVSALPVDGTYPSGTTAYEKRNISELVAVWDSDALHPVRQLQLRLPAQRDPLASTTTRRSLEGAPDGFPSAPLDAVGLPDTRYTLQVYVEDCTGCGLCVEACPVAAPGDPVPKAINLAPREPLVAAERENIAFFETLPATTARASTSAPCAAPSSSSRCSSSPARARAAARRRTSSCCRSCSATG